MSKIPNGPWRPDQAEKPPFDPSKDEIIGKAAKEAVKTAGWKGGGIPFRPDDPDPPFDPADPDQLHANAKSVPNLAEKGGKGIT